MRVSVNKPSIPIIIARFDVDVFEGQIYVNDKHVVINLHEFIYLYNFYVYKNYTYIYLFIYVKIYINKIFNLPGSSISTLTNVNKSEGKIQIMQNTKIKIIKI